MIEMPCKEPGCDLKVTYEPPAHSQWVLARRDHGDPESKEITVWLYCTELHTHPYSITNGATNDEVN